MMSHYLAGYAPTETYRQGMKFIKEDRLPEAVAALDSEPTDSPCYGLALANSGQALLRQELFQLAENRSRRALETFSSKGCPHPPSWVQCARNLAESVGAQNRRHEAISLHEDAEQIGEDLAAKYPEHAEVIHQQLGHILNSCGAVCLALRLFPESAEFLRKALAKYRQYSPNDPTGLAETLTNYGIALSQTDRKTEAHFAFQEALSVSKNTNNRLQVSRVEVAMIQMDFSTVANPLEVLSHAASEAEETGFFSTAVIRWVIKSNIALELGDLKTALEAIQQALLLESKLDKGEISPAKLRVNHARLLLANGYGSEDAIHTLVDGARHWFNHLRAGLISADFRTVTTEMHNMFRLLTDQLITVSRVDEAVVAFEAGRALAHTIEVNSQKGTAILQQSPFNSVSGTLDCSMLKQQQGMLDDGETLVSIAILPLKLVAFIIRKERVEVIQLPLPTSYNDLAHLLNDIQAIPSHLDDKLGVNAIPAPLRDFSSKLATAIGADVVVGLFPSHVLHVVPWRAILRHAGLEWTQLLFATEFSLLVHERRRLEVISSCTALGFGSAGSIDLVQEARDFARPFGQKGITVERCTDRDLRGALASAEAVLVSCHGEISNSVHSRTRLELSLAGGDVAADDVFPETINSRLVILSACHSGVYFVSWGDYPVGAAPSLIRAGAKYCVGARFPVGAAFAAAYMKEFSLKLANGQGVPTAFVEALEVLEARGANYWNDIACFELLSGG